MLLAFYFEIYKRSATRAKLGGVAAFLLRDPGGSTSLSQSGCLPRHRSGRSWWGSEKQLIAAFCPCAAEAQCLLACQVPTQLIGPSPELANATVRQVDAEKPWAVGEGIVAAVHHTVSNPWLVRDDQSFVAAPTAAHGGRVTTGSDIF